MSGAALTAVVDEIISTFEPLDGQGLRERSIGALTELIGG